MVFIKMLHEKTEIVCVHLYKSKSRGVPQGDVCKQSVPAALPKTY